MRSLGWRLRMPREIASRSLIRRTVGILSFLESRAPSINPHLIFTALHLFRLTGPAIAKRAKTGWKEEKGGGEEVGDGEGDN